MYQSLQYGPMFALVNNASIFEPFTWENTGLGDWNHTLLINLAAPYLLSQAFARSLGQEGTGRIVNLLDSRSLAPGADHLSYAISKSALADLTRSLAGALAPRVAIDGLALGAVLPPSRGSGPADILDKVPAHRWADLAGVGQALFFCWKVPPM